jgi:hypothetical protein
MMHGNVEMSLEMTINVLGLFQDLELHIEMWVFISGVFGLMLPTLCWRKYRRGSKNKNINNIGKNIEKYQKML